MTTVSPGLTFSLIPHTVICSPSFSTHSLCNCITQSPELLFLLFVIDFVVNVMRIHRLYYYL